MNHPLWLLAARLFVLLCVVSFCGQRADADPRVSFRSDVAPLLLEHCSACHSAKNAEGGYRVDTFAELVKPGDSGELPIGNDADSTSELLRRLTVEDEFERMPAESEPLPAEAIRVITAWVNQGATFDGDDANESLAFVTPASRYPDPPASYPAALPITAIAFSPDGSQLLVGGYHEITVWDVADATLVQRIANLGQRVFAIALSSDGKQIAVACGEPGRGGEVRLVDLQSGEVKADLARSTDVALDVAFHPNRPLLAIAAADSQIRIVDTQTLQIVRSLAGHADWVTAVAWSPDGTRLASASRDRSAKVFDTDSGELLASYTGHGAAVRGVMFAPDGQHVLSSGTDSRVHRWEATGGQQVATIPLGGEGFRLTARGETHALVPVANKRLLQVDFAGNTISQTYTGLDDWVLVAASHGGTHRIAAGAFNGEVAIWEIDKPAPVRQWSAQP